MGHNAGRCCCPMRGSGCGSAALSARMTKNLFTGSLGEIPTCQSSTCSLRDPMQSATIPSQAWWCVGCGRTHTLLGRVLAGREPKERVVAPLELVQELARRKRTCRLQNRYSDLAVGRRVAPGWDTARVSPVLFKGPKAPTRITVPYGRTRGAGNLWPKPSSCPHSRGDLTFTGGTLCRGARGLSSERGG
jgi:hypothetical protein